MPQLYSPYWTYFIKKSTDSGEKVVVCQIKNDNEDEIC